jgi:hypothetical protein
MKATLEIRRNKSITYLLPIFTRFVPVSYFRLLENTYLWFDDYTEETFCLLYKFDGKVRGTMASREGFTVYEERVLQRNKYYQGSDDYDKYVIFKFLLPEEMFQVRNLFLEGKYSKYSDEHKAAILDHILRFYGPAEKVFIERIFQRDPELRQQLLEKLGPSTYLPPDAEVSSAPYIEDELFANAVKFKEEINEPKRVF